MWIETKSDGLINLADFNHVFVRQQTAGLPDDGGAKRSFQVVATLESAREPTDATSATSSIIVIQEYPYDTSYPFQSFQKAKGDAEACLQQIREQIGAMVP